jgi:hypothetical protein
MRYATDRILGIQKIVTMAEAGDISAEQALRAIAVESGLREQSDGAKRLGVLIKQVSDGEAPASALVAWIEAES